ncbi:MAG: FAD-dependent oxidoreductase, partial [Sneathiellales bacterium]|nr:FAD-dependent oxidoreductase [Sneathiellales bacterium]
FYAKPEAGTLMVSPADEDPVEPHDAWADDMVLAEGLHRFEEATTMAVTRVEHSWAGLRTFTHDKTPVVGFAPDADGFFWLAGQGGYGIQTAPALSKLTADLIFNRQSDVNETVKRALSAERFIGP